MNQYGITNTGFQIKPFQAILTEKAERAQQMFGRDVDLRSTSALRKLLDLTSFEDHELWKSMEQLYYSNFISTASGDALDLLGEDVGVSRRWLQATGTVRLQLSGAAPGRTYYLPLGTIVETAAPVKHFRTLAPVSLSESNPEAEVAIEALARGEAGRAAAEAINQINPTYAQRYLNLGTAAIAISNPVPTQDWDRREEDSSYRDLLLGYPRTLWTLEAVRHAVKNVDGVRDCRLFDPAGGVDVSLSKFGVFAYNQRQFGTQRFLGTPYYFDILVATHPGFLWESAGGVVGIREQVARAIQEVRPIGIFPNLRRANNVLVGIRARAIAKPGHDKNAVIAAIKEKLARRIDALGLGSHVLYSEVLCDCMAVSGVVDVRELHLRRCPPLLSRITFGSRQRFQPSEIEAAVGENLSLQPEEIAEFKVDADLIEIEVSDR